VSWVPVISLVMIKIEREGSSLVKGNNKKELSQKKVGQSSIVVNCIRRSLKKN